MLFGTQIRYSATVNPFQYQGPVQPSDLIDRSSELHALHKAAADRVNIRLAAPRRYGKSSLLEAHMAAMRAAGHRAVRVDFYRVATVTDVAARLAVAYRALPADPGRLWDQLTRRLGLTLGPAGVTIQAGARGTPTAPTADQSRQILLELLDLPARLHAHDDGLTVVCLDEFQDLLTADDRLDGLFRSVTQHHGRAAAYVYAGSRPSLMREMFSNHERPFYAQARPLALPPLPADEAISDLGAIFAAHGIEPTDTIVDLVTAAQGHPQRTMLLAHHAFNLLSEDDPPQDVAGAALELALAETADAHQAAWDALARTERAVVVALADGRSPTGQVAAREHATSRSGMQRALDRLVEAGQHVIRDGHRVRLLDPLFERWLQQR